MFEIYISYQEKLSVANAPGKTAHWSVTKHRFEECKLVFRKIDRGPAVLETILLQTGGQNRILSKRFWDRSISSSANFNE